jgi:glutathione synthase/RimK-type ligase-like ATP-grasp enzyme
LAADGQGTEPGCRRAVLVLNGNALGAQLPESADIAGIDTAFGAIEDLAFEVVNGRVQVSTPDSNRAVSDFDLVQVAAYPSGTAILISALAEYLTYHQIRSVNVANIGPPTKLSHCLRLALAGLPVPATVSYPLSTLYESYPKFEDEFGLPFVLKAVKGSGGRANHLITRDDDYVDRLHQLGGTRLLAQEFVPNDCTLRLLVMGGEVALAMRRTNPQSLYLTNTQQGGQAELIDPADLDPAVATLAAEAASLFDYEVAGVNLMQHWTTGQWYILDVNYSPALTTGAYVPEKLNAYAAYLARCLPTPEHSPQR